MKKKKQSVGDKSLVLHKKYSGKLAVASKVPLRDMKDLALVYTPGVGSVSSHVAEYKEQAREYTMKGNTVAVISDGSAVLGLGNIGPLGALPVMEGKCLLFKQFAGIDALPIVLDTQDSKEIIRTIKAISPGFGGINLEDFSAPRCFEIEEKLKKELEIPVMHDDQHGTAIVVLAGLVNALKVVKKKIEEVDIVIAGAGAAGTAIVKLLKQAGVKKILVSDRQGIIYKGRKGLKDEKKLLATITNEDKKKGSLEQALIGADVFIGVSAPNLLTSAMVRTMSSNSIIFALSNPVPEIMPHEARKGGARVIATGRSDFPNQLNNALVFPGVFRGALDNRVRTITDEMKLQAGYAIAHLIKKPTAEYVVPSIFDKRLVKAVARSIRE
jgi:malate dehydrogenase (oxaloacetate-decarboxylating)